MALDFRKNFKGMILIFIPCKNKKEAQRIGHALVKKRIAACCVILPGATSFYFWKGKLVKSRETMLLIKTLEKKAADAEREIEKLHSYKIPAIITISAKNVNKIYLQWMKKVIR